ncbi:MAG: acyltransferase family protein [Chitinophagales bacterium]|nr:acyltransferase family protein [Chitinophagales bacterium]HMV14428.1 lysophospholipid acyltransferase family protein [Chitinophagales bacterium]HMW12445.1 lysophospholipid acyltransferase family protein [Chitinophagales bacterium]HMX59756.1 lysophospholipid acyltransferase family protein [Chitinophagales bacterium]HMY22563.1 lysophospholipid acyltransferase family protein [Chitinophagales bacterium]
MTFKEIIQQITNPKEVTQSHEFISKFPNKVGSYGYDAWGFNINGIKPFVGMGRFFYENFFRVEVHGLENIPKEGRCLIIANHSGQLPIDGMMLGYAVVTNPHAPRAPKGMYERFVPQVPFISSIFSQWGGTVGDPENCIKMLENDEAVIVFPEGARGISKSYKKKYQLQRFGLGFMYMAIQTKSPIIPVGMVGFEESMINFGNIDFLERFLKFPAAPALVPFVFPSKVIINIGKPMTFEGDISREYQVNEKVDEVKKEINRLIDVGLQQRKGIFSK